MSLLWTQWISLTAGHAHAAGWGLMHKQLATLTDREFLAYLLISVGLVVMAGMMSGLTLGLMSLDEVDLEVLRRSGNSRQRACAERISPVLTNPHRLLVTLLVCNAAAAEALPLFLDRLTDPVTAVIISVTVVLLFGEIIPQAACSAYGVEIGAMSAPFVRVLMLLTSPINVPIGWILNRVLGHRQTALFRRGELKALVDIHGAGQEFGGHLSTDEVAIIKGALDLTNKTAKAAMTPLDMVFMLSLDAPLDEPTLMAVLASGHSRIPVHRPANRGDILGILLVKELILVDPKAGVAVSGMKIRSVPHLLAATPMYDMLKLFELGRSHMAVLTQPTPEALARRRAEQSEVAIDIYSIEDGISEEEDGGGVGRGEEGEGGLYSEADTSSSSSGSSVDSDLQRRASVFSLDFLPDEVAAVGIITIEDVLEELLGHEIVDETDQFVDNLHKTRVNAAVLARTLPPYLRKALAGMTTRMGPAGAMSSYHPAVGATADEAAAAAAAVISGAAARPRSAPAPAAMRKATSEAAEFGGGAAADYYSRLPRMMRPSNPRDGSVAAQLGGVADGGGAGGPARHQRRRTNITQEVHDQLHLLEPLLAARKVRFAHSAGSEGGGEIKDEQPTDRAVGPGDT